MRHLLLASALFASACHVNRAQDIQSANQQQQGYQAAPAATVTPKDALDPRLSTYAYPFRVKYLALSSQLQDLKMAYVDVPPRSAPNGKVVLLLHGKNFSAAYWELTIRALANEGYRVIAPDQIGFGKSSKPASFQYTFETLADHTRTLLDALQVEKVMVVGHSMGGMLAARFALTQPQRTEKLVLVNPIGLEDYRALVGPASTTELYKKELAQTPEKIKDYMRNAYFAGEWKREYDALVEPLAGWTKHPNYPLVAWNAALTGEMIYSQPVVHDLPRITAPTLLIIGQRDRTAIGKDRATPDIAARMGDYPTLGKTAAAAMGAKLVEIQGAGHLPQIEAFDEYRAALLGFLQSAATRDTPAPSTSTAPAPRTTSAAGIEPVAPTPPRTVSAEGVESVPVTP